MKVTAQTSPAPARRDVRLYLRAFTLLEVMLATMVMALAIVTSLEVLQRGLQSIDTARCTTLAGQILQSQMEKLRLLTWSQLTGNGTGTSGPMAIGTFTPDIIASGSSSQVNRFTSVGGGNCSQSISWDNTAPYNISPPTPALSSMVNITLTVTWLGIDSIPRSRIYTTRYAYNGISDFYYTAH